MIVNNSLLYLSHLEVRSKRHDILLMNNEDTAAQVLCRLREKFATNDVWWGRYDYYNEAIYYPNPWTRYVHIAEGLELTPEEIATMIIFYAIKRVR